MTRILIFGAPLLILGALFALFASQINRDTSFVPSVLINKPAPDFELAGLQNYPQNENGFSTTDLTGNVSIVNIFASWCGPCRDEHPQLMALKQLHPEINFFGINQKDENQNAIAFLNELGDPYTAIGVDNNGRASIDWGVYGVPETFVVNAKGIITHKHIGPISPQSLQDNILPAIAAAQNGS